MWIFCASILLQIPHSDYLDVSLPDAKRIERICFKLKEIEGLMVVV